MMEQLTQKLSKQFFYSATSRCLPGAETTGPPWFGRGVHSSTAAGTERRLRGARRISPRAVGVLIRVLKIHCEDSFTFPFLTQRNELENKGQE